jgi:hypothetical protein
MAVCPDAGDRKIEKMLKRRREPGKPVVDLPIA